MSQNSIVNKDIAGYTVLVKDKYILCGTSRSSHWKTIDNIGTSKIRQYYSVKILLNNIGHHIHSWWSKDFSDELDAIMYEHGWVSKPYYQGDYPRPDYFNKKALKYLLETGILKIIRIEQIVSIEPLEEILDGLN